MTIRPRTFRRWPGIRCPLCGAHPYAGCRTPGPVTDGTRRTDTHAERWDALADAEKRAAFTQKEGDR